MRLDSRSLFLAYVEECPYLLVAYGEERRLIKTRIET